ncbi:MAG: RraA family protein [Pirellulaceae bacterium]|nr:RraA family protein [Pirellulaceae bacterium]
MTNDTLKKLTQFDTPTICNVIELFEVRPFNAGYMDQRIEAAFPEFEPMIGYAVTASFRSDAPPQGGDVYGSMAGLLEEYATLPGPPVMVFQDLDDPTVAATFGEVMCSTFQAYGSAGLITSGAGRDLLQVKDLGYPVFTSGTNCSHAYCHLLHIGLPIRVGGLMVNRGDLLHGDANGVTNIPVELASEIADVADEFVKAEEIVMDYVKSDAEKTVPAFKDRFDEFQAVKKQIIQRVSRKPK